MKNIIAYLMVLVSLFAGSTAALNAQKPQILEAASEAKAAFTMASEASGASERIGPAFFEVGAGSVRYHTYRVTAGERIRIELRGDGDTDLDMYVYSPDGTLIDEQASYSDAESSNFRSYRSGMITVKIVNCGNVYNRYNLSVWGN